MELAMTSYWRSKNHSLLGEVTSLKAQPVITFYGRRKYAEILRQHRESMRNQVFHYSSKYIDVIFDYVLSSKTTFTKPSRPKELTVSHIHSFIGGRRDAKGIGSMSAEGKSEAYTKGVIWKVWDRCQPKGLESKSASSNSQWEEQFAEFEA
jgi:hypothetical protein